MYQAISTKFIRPLSFALVFAICFTFLFATTWNQIFAQDSYRNNRRPTYRETDRERRVQEQLRVQHFRSGAQQSEVILKEISDTLKRMEKRVEKLELLAEAMYSATPNRPKSNPVYGRTR